MHRLFVSLALIAVFAVVVFAFSAANAVGRPAQTSSESIFGLTLVSVARAGQPAVQESTAKLAAMNRLASLNSDVHDLHAKASVFKTGLVKAVDTSGNQILQEEAPHDAWVFEFTGSSAGYSTVEGIVIVDATTGEVMGASLLQTN